MSTSRERLDDLLCDKVLWGLDDAEERELAVAVAAGTATEGELDELERAGAAIASVMVQDSCDDPPLEVRERLAAAAARYLGQPLRAPVGSTRGRWSGPGPMVAPRRAAGIAPFAGWVAAAAAAVVAVVLWLERPSRHASVDEELRAFLTAQSDVVRLHWTTGPEGDVLWSPSAQRGFLVWRGLPDNDPGAFQYQLWIFDRERSRDTPVDGGVFDCAERDRELVVPIAAKLLVHDAFAFAVTKEEPGGVVVSAKRPEQIVAAVGL